MEGGADGAVGVSAVDPAVKDVGGSAGADGVDGDKEIRAQRVLLAKQLAKKLDKRWSSKRFGMGLDRLQEAVKAWPECLQQGLKPRILLALLQRERLSSETVKAEVRNLVAVAAQDSDEWVKVTLALLSDVVPGMVPPEAVSGCREYTDKMIAEDIKRVADFVASYKVDSKDKPLHPSIAPEEMGFLSDHLLPDGLKIGPEVVHVGLKPKYKNICLETSFRAGGASGLKRAEKRKPSGAGAGGAQANPAKRMRAVPGSNGQAKKRPSLLERMKADDAKSKAAKR